MCWLSGLGLNTGPHSGSWKRMPLDYWRGCSDFSSIFDNYFTNQNVKECYFMMLWKANKFSLKSSVNNLYLIPRNSISLIYAITYFLNRYLNQQWRHFNMHFRIRIQWTMWCSIYQTVMVNHIIKHCPEVYICKFFFLFNKIVDDMVVLYIWFAISSMLFRHVVSEVEWKTNVVNILHLFISGSWFYYLWYWFKKKTYLYILCCQVCFMKLNIIHSRPTHDLWSDSWTSDDIYRGDLFSKVDHEMTNCPYCPCPPPLPPFLIKNVFIGRWWIW